ncbi:MAG: rod shape-determining protein MreC [Pyrinomonadaceae bacterium MAG19_C2-C3]|nr:rod shape-determining protein MreC [Pyrinomonadaceae bacterium MAG19_C2-C3]
MRTQREVRQRAPAWFVGLLVVNFAAMVLSARDAGTSNFVVRGWAQGLVSIVQRPVSSVGSAGKGLFESVWNFRQAAAENERLRLEVTRLEMEAREGEFARSENERLRGLLDLREQAGFETIMARVIARDPTGWFDSVTINRGSLAGIEKGMPVVTPTGIVGRIVNVGTVTAQVMLLTNELSGAGAVIGQLGSSNSLGAVRGMGEHGLLEMRHISGLETVKAGDSVTTSGQDRVYPPGLNIGTIYEVREGSATASHMILVRPSAQLEQLEQVAVLRYQPPPPPEINTAPPSSTSTTSTISTLPVSTPTPRPSPSPTPRPTPRPSPRATPMPRPSPTPRPATNANANTRRATNANVRPANTNARQPRRQN